MPTNITYEVRVRTRAEMDAAWAADNFNDEIDKQIYQDWADDFDLDNPDNPNPRFTCTCCHNEITEKETHSVIFLVRPGDPWSSVTAPVCNRCGLDVDKVLLALLVEDVKDRRVILEYLWRPNHIKAEGSP